MDSPVSAISYLGRARQLLDSGDRASLIYSALELRCGVEARLKEHATVADGVSQDAIGSLRDSKARKDDQ
jgi:hypothetical protein